MVKEGLDSVLLDTQYRMVLAIARWPSEEFYDSHLHTAARLEGPREPPKGFPWPNARLPICFVHHEGQQQSDDSSLYNRQEVEIVAGIVRDLLRAGNAPADLCVLTPYAAQRTALRRRLRWAVQQSLVVDCVDKFQGQERKIVVLSLVCSNTRGSIVFCLTSAD